MTPVRFADQPTPGGYLCGEVASAMQKAIRRGNEREALFWSSELDLSGFGNYVWKRLRIIASEDVGLADTNAVIALRVLNENWLEAKKQKTGDSGAPLFLAHAVCLLARAEKSGVIVHAVMAIWLGDRQAMGMEIPDHALDMHTARGRQMGRGKKHFLEEAGLLVNETLPDPYREEGAAAWTASRTSREPRRSASEVRPTDQLPLGGEELPDP
jgi:replication-associated recombination protein RarA